MRSLAPGASPDLILTRHRLLWPRRRGRPDIFITKAPGDGRLRPAGKRHRLPCRNLLRLCPKALRCWSPRKPKDAFAVIGRAMFPTSLRLEGDGSGVPVHASAIIEEGAVICAGAVIGAGAGIGSGTVVGANAVIGPGCQIGTGLRHWPLRFHQQRIDRQPRDAARRRADRPGWVRFCAGTRRFGKNAAHWPGHHPGQCGNRREHHH